MAFPITSALYPDVRAAIDTSLDSTTLPDATIALSIYAPAAAADIKLRDPAWASRTGESLARLERAHVLLTASLLAPAIPSLTAEQTDDYRYTRQSVDWVSRAADLAQRAGEEIAAITDPTNTAPSRPTFFSVATGRRGR